VTELNLFPGVIERVGAVAIELRTGEPHRAGGVVEERRLILDVEANPLMQGQHLRKSLMHLGVDAAQVRHRYLKWLLSLPTNN
jgi:hypothetical protein